VVRTFTPLSVPCDTVTEIPDVVGAFSLPSAGVMWIRAVLAGRCWPAPVIETSPEDEPA
jgi:hypothetical protein